MLVSSPRDCAAFRSDHYNAVPLAGSAHCKVMLVCLEAGQFIPVHSPGIDLSLVVLEGRGTMCSGEEEKPLGPGGVLFAAAGEARGIRAETRLVLFTVVSPPPTEADHVEVHRKLKAGTWR